LCCGIEHNGNRTVYAAIQKWLSGKVALDKPEKLPGFGSLTITSLSGATSGVEYMRLVWHMGGKRMASLLSTARIARFWIQIALNKRRGFNI